MSRDCAICRLHSDPVQVSAFEIVRTPLWVLRHHHHPAPMLGWLLLDTLRHCSGPVDFKSDESSRYQGSSEGVDGSAFARGQAGGQASADANDDGQGKKFHG